jgi:ribonuclease-3
MTPVTQRDLEQILGFNIVDLSKYERAFKHKSASDTPGDSYERLEWLGDQIVNMSVSIYLFERYPGENEGFLTRVRTKLVCKECLSSLSLRLGLHRFVEMNERAINNEWNMNARILTDVFESLVCCVWQDLGLATAKAFVISTIERFVDFNHVISDTNYKDILIRHAQAQARSLEFRVTNDPHVTKVPLFEVVAHVGDVPCGMGRDKSKKVAEQQAARNALVFLRVPLG